MIEKIRDILGSFNPNRVVDMPIPDDFYIPERHYPRRTGRTLKMLHEAIGILLGGNDVIIFFGNHIQCVHYQRIVEHILNAMGIKLEHMQRHYIRVHLWQGYGSIKFATKFDHRQYLGVPEKDIPIFLYDHYYLELGNERS